MNSELRPRTRNFRAFFALLPLGPGASGPRIGIGIRVQKIDVLYSENYIEKKMTEWQMEMISF